MKKVVLYMISLTALVLCMDAFLLLVWEMPYDNNLDMNPWRKELLIGSPYPPWAMKNALFYVLFHLLISAFTAFYAEEDKKPAKTTTYQQHSA